MTIEEYSALLSIGLMALFVVLVASGILYATLPVVRRHIQQHSYFTFLSLTALIGAGSVFGALIYQLYYLTPVCELCWWQRIFLFPTVVIALVALWYRSKEAHVTIGILSLLGLFYAGYHYYYHYQGLVLGKSLSLPCSSGGLLPACTDSPILTFGFITIPFMSILVFSSLILLAVFAHLAARRERAV